MPDYVPMTKVELERKKTKLRSRILEVEELSGSLKVGDKVVTGKGEGEVILLDKDHPGEYYRVWYFKGHWKDSGHWEHVTSIRRFALYE